jgi:hypothetical protein
VLVERDAPEALSVENGMLTVEHSEIDAVEPRELDQRVEETDDLRPADESDCDVEIARRLPALGPHGAAERPEDLDIAGVADLIEGTVARRRDQAGESVAGVRHNERMLPVGALPTPEAATGVGRSPGDVGRSAIATPSVRHVAAEIEFQVADPVTIVLQVATAGACSEERFDARMGDLVLEPEVVDLGTGRAHVVRTTAPGRLSLTYAAATAPAAAPGPPLESDVLVALRQSRYCNSDQLWGFAQRELAGATGPEVADWVSGRIRYDIWGTNAYDTAIDTLTTGAGVCRDFAHLTIALCRAVGVPARLVSVYAPGLMPMDFHAVVEVVHDGAWAVVDPTRMAPRQSLVRIATGRDAADTAFADTIRGQSTFERVAVTAVIDGDLPIDDHSTVVHLA